ncbi:MAG: nucleotide exchange factor GrpE [Waddliaceae bacterium]
MNKEKEERNEEIKGVEEEGVQEEREKEPQQVSITDVELEQLKNEAGQFKHKYLHLLADSENARRRLQKERQELIQYAMQNLILDFLHPIDHMENALKFTEEASEEVKHWATGFQMILNQFRDVLVNQGVKPIDAYGKEFDPHLHEAIEMVATTEYPPGIVVEESVRGYVHGDKTLRPSRVKVSKAPAAEEAAQEQAKEKQS